MKNHLKFVFLLLAFSATSMFYYSCKPAVVSETVALDLDQIKTEIQAMEDAFSVAQQAGDAAAVAVYYADDALSLANNAPMASGKEAIIKQLESDIASNISVKAVTTFEVVDITASGDLVVEVGKSTTKDSTGIVLNTGKYISVFEKRDGKYVCIRDAYNQDAK